MNYQELEQEIQANGANVAPRITPMRGIETASPADNLEGAAQ